ncbi:hypothetical protein GCM10009827_010850 [Dactylosporangium maewongense]|uniref:Uncharacterized protein n=1 Tax=Dactylosporangium maewongense TaxID=634393 RepID=A0ABN1ZNB8_9ACTN
MTDLSGAGDRPSSTRPAVWWFAVPPALLLVFLCVAGALAPQGGISGERAARPVAGPGSSVHFELRPGTTFTVYQDAPTSRAGMNCSVALDDGDPSGLSTGSGGQAGGMFGRRPRRVFVGGTSYNYAMQLADNHTAGITVSCSGGDVLVESGTTTSWTSAAVTGAAVATTGAALVLIAARRRRQLP